jgi:hypothetical protein
MWEHIHDSAKSISNIHGFHKIYRRIIMTDLLLVVLAAYETLSGADGYALILRGYCLPQSDEATPMSHPQAPK